MHLVNLKNYIETLESGSRPKGGATNSGIPSLGGEHINSNGGFNIEEKKLKYVPNEYYNLLKKGIIKKNDILIVKDGATTGKVAYVDENFILNKACINEHIFLLRTNEKLYSKYLFYFLYSNRGQQEILKDFRGATVGGISKKFININFHLPSLKDQNKIVEILDISKELIVKRKTQIEALDELVKSRFIEMFGDPITNSKGWEVKLLGEVCDMKAGKNIKACDISEVNSEELYPCYGGNGLRGYVKQYSHEGNIPLIGRQGALCGNVKYAQGKFYATEHAVVTQPKVEMNTYWLYYLLNELDLNRFSTGAAQPGLTVGKLNLVEIPIAPFDMQNEFEKLVNQVDKLKLKWRRA